MKTYKAFWAVAGEEIEQYVENIYSVSPDIRKRLDFLVRTRKTS